MLEDEFAVIIDELEFNVQHEFVYALFIQSSEVFLHSLYHFVEFNGFTIRKNRGIRREGRILQTHGLHSACARNDGDDFRAGIVLGVGDGRFAELHVRVNPGNGIIRDVLGNDDPVRFFRGVGRVNGDAHLYGELVDVPERAFLESLERPYRSPDFADFKRGQILGLGGRFEGLVEPRAVEVGEVFGIGAGAEADCCGVEHRAHLGIECRAECRIDGNVAEHILDIVKHRFAGAGIRCEVRKARDTHDVIDEMSGTVGGVATGFNLFAKGGTAAFFFTVRFGKRAEAIRHYRVIDEVIVMVEGNGESIRGIVRENCVELREVRRLDADFGCGGKSEFGKFREACFGDVVSEYRPRFRLTFPVFFCFREGRLFDRVSRGGDNEFDEVIAEGEKRIRDVVPVECDVRRIARFCREIHMRKRGLRVLGDGATNERNFRGKRFKDNDIVRGNNRRIKFTCGEFAERAVGRARIHYLEHDISKDLRVRAHGNVCKVETIRVSSSDGFRGATRRHIIQAVPGCPEIQELEAFLNCKVSECDLRGCYFVRGEEGERDHRIHGSVIDERACNSRAVFAVVGILFERGKRAQIAEDFLREAVVQRIFDGVLEMYCQLSTVHSRDDEFDEVAFADFGRRCVGEFLEGFVAVIFGETRCLGAVFDECGERIERYLRRFIFIEMKRACECRAARGFDDRGN